MQDSFYQVRIKLKEKITPDYGILIQERIQFIKRVMPDVKLILVARNPIDRAWSAARRIFSKQSENYWEEMDESEIYEFFTHQTHTYHGDYEPELNYGDYSRIINKWLSEFPHEQFRLYFFDEIKSSPRKLLINIFSFLGVSTVIDWSEFPYETVFNRNPNMVIPIKFKKYLEELYCEEIELLHEVYGDRLTNWRC